MTLSVAMAVKACSRTSRKTQIYRTAPGEPSVGFLERGRAARHNNRVAAVAVNMLCALRRLISTYLLIPDSNITWLPFALRVGRQAVRQEQVDAIVTTCPPHSAALTGIALKLLTRKPLILDFRDDWIDTPWHRSKHTINRHIERWLEWGVVQAADRVILVTQWSQAAFLQRYPRQPASKFLFIPNGCDLADFAIIDRSVLPIHEDFTIVHAGLLSATEEWKRNPEPFFKALAEIRSQHPDTAGRVRVVFTGRLPKEYRELIPSYNLEEIVEESGFLSWNDLIHLMTSADLLLTINYEGFDTLVPGKIYEYWAVGGPPILLLSCPGAASQLIETHQLGATCDPYDVVGMKQYIIELAQSRRAGVPVRINTAGIEQYDRAHLAHALASVLDDLAGSAFLATALPHKP